MKTYINDKVGFSRLKLVLVFFLIPFTSLFCQIKRDSINNFAKAEVLVFEIGSKNLSEQSKKNIKASMDYFKRENKTVIKVKLFPIICESNYKKGIKQYKRQMKLIKRYILTEYKISKYSVQIYTNKKEIQEELISPCEYEYIKISYVTRK